LSATLLYLKIVLYWPEDDRLRSKHVAVMLPNFIYYITVLIYCCVLTIYNTSYKSALLHCIPALKTATFQNLEVYRLMELQGNRAD